MAIAYFKKNNELHKTMYITTAVDDIGQIVDGWKEQQKRSLKNEQIRE